MVGSAVIHFVLIVLLVLTARRLAKKHRRGQKQKPKPVKSLTSANFKMKEAEPLKSTETAPNQTQTVDLWK
ncbi:unnamed protein product [Heligmosomoides polygyrus]|uniref:Secreted protein n=1 Tax=Heligmosomoides polygyrus TaxID=6339 RepID=A0A183FRG1_HELPZ|nr:unnamed protein product [Heligmosomoides polygyrus]